MREWIVALPIWGDRYCRTFVKWCLPSWKVALAPLEGRVRFFVFTDNRELADAIAPLPVEIMPLPNGDTPHARFSNAHRQALALAPRGAAVALQNADHITSREAFVSCEKRFDEGYKAVVCAGTRTVGPLFDEPAPVDICASDLLGWALTRAHPIIQQSLYPTGKSAIPSVMYFTDGTNTISRSWHLHPFAVIKDRELDFAGTIDWDLCNAYQPHEIHVVTANDELAMAEISPMTKRLPLLPGGMNHEYIAWWATKHTTDRHREFFRHRIVIEGSADTDCDAPADDILERLRLREAA